MIVNVKGKVVKIYDSIEDMPIENFKAYNRFLLIDSGIGSDFEDVDKHIERVAAFMATDKEAAVQELQNLRQNLYYIQQNINPKLMAFAALVYEIDGKNISDLSDDGIKNTVAMMGDIKKGLLYRIVETIKKKVESELNTLFPKFFDSARIKEAYDKVKREAFALLDSIITDDTSQSSGMDALAFELTKPQAFPEAEISYLKSFETSIASLQRKGVYTKGMTVLRFYSIMELVEREAKELDKKKR